MNDLTTALTTLNEALPVPLTSAQVEAAADLLSLLLPDRTDRPPRLLLLTDTDLAGVPGVPVDRVRQWHRRYQWPCSTSVGRPGTRPTTSLRSSRCTINAEALSRTNSGPPRPRAFPRPAGPL